MTELRCDFRSAWLVRDLDVVARILQDLAPLYDYRARELARGLQMTSRNLQRVLVTTIGYGPRKWLNHQRLLAAKELLAMGHSIKGTAYRLAYRNPSQFSRDFRRQFGMSPSMFLREHSGTRRPRPSDATRRG